MSWNYTYTPLIWPPVFTALVLIALAVFSYRRRSVPGALPFTFALLFGALWATGYVLEYLAVDSAAKITWVKFQMAWQLPSATAVAFFLLEYAWPGRWLTRRNLALLSIVPFLVILLILTDHLHHLMWRGFVFNKTVTPLLGPVGWIAIVYGYGFTVVNFIVFAWLFLRSPQHRWAVVLIVISQIFFRAVYLLDKTQTLQSDLPLVVIGMAFVCLMYTVALFRFHILSPLPLARQKVIDQMREGMLVLDTEGRVAGLNPAVAAILELPGKQALGRSIREILPPSADQGDESTGESEINLGKGSESRNYLLTTSILKDWRGQEAGRLLLLHDVTEQKQAQAQLLEQQRALAMLHEREQLARELHDGLGQVLAAAHLQASTARMLLDRGETNQVGECLDSLAGTTLQAEADMREYLLGAQPVVSAEQSFLATLHEYLRRFTRQFSLPIELSVPPELEGQELPQTVAVQLLRIIQEGLSNIRKHAHAHCARVSLTLSGARLQVIISDDGLGFELSPVVTQPGAGFGLRSMSERAEALGGILQIESAPGKGTRVVVEVPICSPSGVYREAT